MSTAFLGKSQPGSALDGHHAATAAIWMVWRDTVYGEWEKPLARRLGGFFLFHWNRSQPMVNGWVYFVKVGRLHLDFESVESLKYIPAFVRWCTSCNRKNP